MNIPEHIEELIYRGRKEKYTVEERRIFNGWLEESEMNRKAYREYLSLWCRGRYAGRWGMVGKDQAWGKMEARWLKRRLYRRMWQAAAVAALVMVFTGVGLMVLNFSGGRPADNREECTIEAGGAKAVLVLSSGKRINLDNLVANNIVEGETLITGDSSAIVYRGGEDRKEQNVAYNELIVPAGGEYKLCLSDGTMVYLNSESRLRYPVRFDGTKREVTLDGEAYFEVAGDKKRPFVVHTDKLSVNVLGTGFNVMAYRSEPSTEVTLLHGAVDVRLGNRNMLLKPDQQLVADNRTQEYQVKEVNAVVFAEWKDGVLNFDAIPLEQLVVKLGRWYDVDFFFNGDDLKQLKFSGAFRKYNDINYILNLIEKTTEVNFKINQRTVVVSRR